MLLAWRSVRRRSKSKIDAPDAAAPSPWVAPPAPLVKFRRTWPERFVLVIGVGLIASCLYGAWYISDIKETFGAIPRVAVSPGVLADVGDVKQDARPTRPASTRVIPC